jgi:hypothetical protein
MTNIINNRDDAKQKMLDLFLAENNSPIRSMKSFIAGFPDEYELFDNDLYNMAQELVDEGKLILVTITSPGEDKQSWLMPPGTIVGSNMGQVLVDTRVE